MPRTVDVDERRDLLATAAARVIARDGLAGTTLRGVAAEAGLTTGALTHYFADKQQLLAFTLQASLDRRHARRVHRDGLAPADALRDALLDVLPTDAESRLHWTVTVAFCAQATGDPALAEMQRDAYRSFRAGIARLVTRAGLGGGAAARAQAERLIAAVDGVAIQALFDPESWPAARQVGVVDHALARP